jgi:hypothetical protein
MKKRPQAVSAAVSFAANPIRVPIQTDKGSFNGTQFVPTIKRKTAKKSDCELENLRKIWLQTSRIDFAEKMTLQGANDIGVSPRFREAK